MDGYEDFGMFEALSLISLVIMSEFVILQLCRKIGQSLTTSMLQHHVWLL